ncbi:hypothetical protein E8E13_008273 [Curvularia kusanoi]|uniref:Uncharacterized protein n=1 Tax=Curvularia kusanoi TaxID=90978 RepID=A0A9P4WCY2_CURKU|nr:hypothetical protein E8E13_008273 [Curvularia kusanoi]
MAGEWPRDPRVHGSPQHSEFPAQVRTLPSVAELLSRPSANTTGAGTVYHHNHQDYFHSRSTPPAASLPTPTTAPAPAASYWNQVNHHQTSPPVSPTEQRPPQAAAVPREPAPRTYQEPTFRRQQVPKADSTLHYSTLSSGVQNASHSTGQARQDSAIDHHRFEASNGTQLSNSNVSYSRQSPKDSQRQSSPRPESFNSPLSAPAYTTVAASTPSEIPLSQAGTHIPARQHSKSLSSGSPYLASSKSHEHSTERPIAKNGIEPRSNIAGPSSLPEQFFTQQNNFGTRQQRYNVRFAANYTSENMPPSQKPRNGSPTPPTAPPVVTEPEQPRSSPAPVSTPEEMTAPPTTTNGKPRQNDSQTRATRDARERSEREPSVERCVGCNEAWRRPIPDMDQELAPAENNADYMRLTSNFIDRLRDQRRRVDAAYEDWKHRHSYCHRPASPHSTASLDDNTRRGDLHAQKDGLPHNHTGAKRKPEAPLEPQTTSKQRRMTSTSPAPPVQKPDSS